MLYETYLRRFRAICPDGKVRTARPTAEADTMFSIPARVSAHGRTVSGFVVASDAVRNPLLADMLGEAERAAFAADAPYIFYPRRDSANADAAGGAWDS
jgi:hypothetical protein